MTGADAFRAGQDHGYQVAEQEIRRLGAFPLSPEVIQEISHSLNAYGIGHVAGLTKTHLPAALAEKWRAGFHAGVAERLQQHGVQVAELRNLFEPHPRVASQH